MEQIDELAAALAKAQGEMKNAPLNQTNPHFKNKYADLAAVRDATIPALSKHGLAITQTPRLVDGHLILITTLRHTSGQEVISEWPLPIAKPQEMGSALTYAKRYCWAAMCGISADQDDDGNEAQKGSAPTVAKPKPADPPAPLAPRSIVVPNGADKEKNWKAWVGTLKRHISAATLDEVDAWLDQNRPQLDRLETESATAHAHLMDHVTAHKVDLEAQMRQMEAAE